MPPQTALTHPSPRPPVKHSPAVVGVHPLQVLFLLGFTGGHAQSRRAPSGSQGPALRSPTAERLLLPARHWGTAAGARDLIPLPQETGIIPLPPPRPLQQARTWSYLPEAPHNCSIQMLHWLVAILVQSSISLSPFAEGSTLTENKPCTTQPCPSSCAAT